jgi:hypothetical protein
MLSLPFYWLSGKTGLTFFQTTAFIFLTLRDKLQLIGNRTISNSSVPCLADFIILHNVEKLINNITTI